MGTEQQQRTEKPEVTDEHKARPRKWPRSTKRTARRPHCPAAGGAVSGTAVTEWVDDKDKGKIETTAEEGKVEYRKTEEFRKKQAE